MSEEFERMLMIQKKGAGLTVTKGIMKATDAVRTFTVEVEGVNVPVPVMAHCVFTLDVGIYMLDFGNGALIGFGTD